MENSILNITVWKMQSLKFISGSWDFLPFRRNGTKLNRNCDTHTHTHASTLCMNFRNLFPLIKAIFCESGWAKNQQQFNSTSHCESLNMLITSAYRAEEKKNHRKYHLWIPIDSFYFLARVCVWLQNRFEFGIKQKCLFSGIFPTIRWHLSNPNRKKSPSFP